MLLLSLLTVVILLRYSSVESRYPDSVGESLHSLSALTTLHCKSLAPVEVRMNHTEKTGMACNCKRFKTSRIFCMTSSVYSGIRPHKLYTNLYRLRTDDSMWMVNKPLTTVHYHPYAILYLY